MPIKPAHSPDFAKHDVWVSSDQLEWTPHFDILIILPTPLKLGLLVRYNLSLILCVCGVLARKILGFQKISKNAQQVPTDFQESLNCKNKIEKTQLIPSFWKQSNGGQGKLFPKGLLAKLIRGDGFNWLYLVFRWPCDSLTHKLITWHTPWHHGPCWNRPLQWEILETQPWTHTILLIGINNQFIHVQVELDCCPPKYLLKFWWRFTTNTVENNVVENFYER